MSTLHNFLFNVYPYISLTVFFMGSLARLDRDQYTRFTQASYSCPRVTPLGCSPPISSTSLLSPRLKSSSSQSTQGELRASFALSD